MRIAPLYLASALLVLILALIQTGFHLSGDLQTISLQTFRLFGLGLFTWTGLGQVDISHINAGVTWTLQYEWAFYLLLPVLALLVRPARFLLFAAVCWGIYAIYSLGYVPMDRMGSFVHGWVIFLFGMGTAQLVRSYDLRRWLQGPIAALFCMLCLGCMPIVLTDGYTVISYVMCFSVFLCIAGGNSLFGLLTLPAMRLLGTISYSVYLLHGTLLFIASSLLIRITSITAISPLGYWAFVGICGAAIIVISSLTYR
jgi:peptidoglycan/LPS O-acetylase OafA/YrhL